MLVVCDVAALLCYSVAVAVAAVAVAAVATAAVAAAVVVASARR